MLKCPSIFCTLYDVNKFVIFSFYYELMCLFSLYFILGGVKVMYLENATSHEPTIHPPDDGRMNPWICSIGEATNYGENQRTQKKIRLRATSYLTNTARNPLGSNSVLRSEKPPTNSLNYSRVLDFKFYFFKAHRINRCTRQQHPRHKGKTLS
jgi:hypothetical protein